MPPGCTRASREADLNVRVPRVDDDPSVMVIHMYTTRRGPNMQRLAQAQP